MCSLWLKDLEWLKRFKRDSYVKKFPGSKQSLGPEDLCVRGCVRSPPSQWGDLPLTGSEAVFLRKGF